LISLFILTSLNLCDFLPHFNCINGKADANPLELHYQATQIGQYAIDESDKSGTIRTVDNTVII